MQFMKSVNPINASDSPYSHISLVVPFHTWISLPAMVNMKLSAIFGLYVLLLVTQFYSCKAKSVTIFIGSDLPIDKNKQLWTTLNEGKTSLYCLKITQTRCWRSLRLLQRGLRRTARFARLHPPQLQPKKKLKNFGKISISIFRIFFSFFS